MSRSPTTRFSDRADDYRAARPSYPAGAVDAMLAGRGSPATLAAADVGAGTGIMSRLLADRGVRVFAIEPNTPMRNAGEAHPSVTPIDATAEATTLDDRCVDLVVCAQAYHWFDQPGACAEFGRVLKRPGRLALVWNEADETTPVSAGYYALVRAAASADAPYHADAREPHVFPPFGDGVTTIAHYDHTLDADRFVARARSASYVPSSGNAWDSLERELRRLHAQHATPDDRITMRYRTRLWTFDIR